MQLYLKDENKNSKKKHAIYSTCMAPQYTQIVHTARYL